MPLLLYIHGFNSSPAAVKARQTGAWLAENAPGISFECPALGLSPAESIARLEAIVIQAQPQSESVYLVGSSMGGYYASWLAEKYRLPAVLINPAVRPYRSLSDYLGENINYHTGERYTLEPHHLDECRSIDVKQIQYPDNYWVLLQTGDEVLDYRLAAEKYTDCRVTIEQGGDHGFQGYERYLPEIVAFFSTPPRTEARG